MAGAGTSEELGECVSARKWEVVLDEIFDALDGESLCRVPSVCRYWRECCASRDRCEQRWKTIIRREFSIPCASNGELLLWGCQPHPDLPPELAESRQPFFDLWRQLMAKGWWAAEGIEAQDYVSKFYSGQIIGLSRSATPGGHSPSAPSGHPIAQQVLVPSNGCRVLVHFEGWTEKWDEWIVLPTEAARLRPRRPNTPHITGRRTNSDCVIGFVQGLEVLQDDGSTASAAVVGMARPPFASVDEHGIPREVPVGRQWEDAHMQLLLRYESGRQEWLDLSEEAQRNRVHDHVRAYPNPCGCETCLRITGQQEQDTRAAQPPAPRGMSV
mmetsp:Transcript_103953/g.155676  ORF Transcript_103953/g.155676 Transcript_103953/m.155676 type:complete len:328 (+) Transcript_103953:92-1075(+)|eukprot:CAMPEP_0177710630 /NCGR_PEP_ID=MMETSP0484_2-20121128/11436_1 /TAXON_ID=354590 /ORGANISM="Rhodomonas lens, Strain RHODO" /LENGTH=327 /DNA_ID=CAMNT_0019222321 /DNA_START=106 /DNA_END=1089 /DNA_ORIENTATION=-